MYQYSKARSARSLATLALGAACAACAATHERRAEPVTPVSAPSSCEPERDAAAIRAMAGSYSVDFDFTETEALSPGYQLHGRHRSAATELIVVIEDTPGRLSLQHVLVVGGGVVKHWRQDWTFEDRELLEFQGGGSWQRRTLPVEAASCTWTQAVFGVDDSPRYEGYGRWKHGKPGSVWESNETWRPLPRREYTTRSDYDVLVGINRHRISAAGWEHEQENTKLVLEPRRLLAREHGLNTYSKTKATETAPAEAYWRATAPFWKEVRAEWSRVLAPRAQVKLQVETGGKQLHAPLFERATKSDAWGSPQATAFIQSAVAKYLVEEPAAASGAPEPAAPLGASTHQP
jgi:hypothetical protein